MVKDRISDAGGPRFESRTEQVTGKPTPKASGGIGTLQSRASGLQSTTQGNSVWTKKTPPSQTKNNKRSCQSIKAGRSCTDSSVVKDRLSDAGGPRFEPQAGRVTGKPTPSLWRDKHPAIKGLRPPERHAGQSDGLDRTGGCDHGRLSAQSRFPF